MASPDTAEQAKWWQKNGSSREIAQSVTAAIKTLEKYQAGRNSYLSVAARLYSNSMPSLMAGQPGDMQASSLGLGTTGVRLTRNVIQSCVDTIQARVASRIHPMVMWLSTNGSYKARRRAKRLSRFTDGLFREQRTHELMPQMFKDAEVYGSGFVGVGIEHGRLKFDRVIEPELRWDEVEARHGGPRQLHRVRPVDRDVLAALWPSKVATINKAEIGTKDNGHGALPVQTLAPLVQVRESWRLPDGPENPGRHVISIPEGVLVDEKWEHDFFPIIKLDYSRRANPSWTGQGLVEILVDTQVALNRHLHAISTSLYLMGTFKIALEEGSRVDPNHLTNGFGSVFWYRRTPSGGGIPAYLTPPAIQPEVYQECERLEQKAYMLAGISQMTASGIKAPGVNAAVAMRQMVEIENDRFATVSVAYEAAHVQLARVAIELLADYMKTNKVSEYTVQDVGSKRKPLLNFADLEFDPGDFTVQAFPVSALPQDPEGRTQTVQEWIAAGWLDPVMGRKLLRFPDIASYESMQDAAEEFIESVLDAIVDEHKYTAPDPEEDDLATALRLANQEIQAAKLGGLDDDDPEAMTLLRRYKDEVVQITQRAQAAAMPPPAPPGGPPAAAPIGRPPPPPVSELMPMVPQQ